MKTFLALPILLILSGCQTPPPTPAPIAAPTAIPTAESIENAVESAPQFTPQATPIVVQSGRASLPILPQAMGNSPRPTFVPLPTPKVRPGETIVISNSRPTPAPRQNPTIIVSNQPIPGANLSPQDAAARELVWADRKTNAYFRPGQRGYGGTTGGFYMTQQQAIARGYRVAIG